MKRMFAIGTAITAAVSAGILVNQPDATARPTGRHGVERFSIISTTDPSTDTIIGTGLFTAGGTDRASSNVDKIKFPHGKFRLEHSGTRHSHLDATTCLLTTTGSGRYKIVGGTGAYRGITGTGHYRLSIKVVFARTAKGVCDSDTDPTALQYIVSGHGRTSLP